VMLNVARYWQVMGFCSIVLLISSCGNGQRTVKFYNWSYFIPDHVLYDFERETGINIEMDTYESNDQMYSTLRSGVKTYDVTVPSGDFVAIMKREGMLQPLQKADIPNFGNLSQDILAYVDFDPGNVYSIPYAVSVTGLNVNTKYVTEYEESWSLLGREDLWGRTSSKTDTRELLGNALKYLGYSANSTDPLEINEARDFVLTWKEHIEFDDEGYDVSFVAEENWVVHGFPEAVLTALDGDTEHYVFVMPKEGGLIYLDNMVVLANAQNTAEAHEWMNYILRLDVHAAIMDEFWYPTLMPDAQSLRKVVAPYTVADLFENNYEFRADVGSAAGELYMRAWADIMDLFRWSALIEMHANEVRA
jgi:spermidine/putrescine transport system substrate-binding protein